MGFLIASGVCVVCVVILFVGGNRYTRAALALFVSVIAGGYALFIAYASGFLAYLAERFL